MNIFGVRTPNGYESATISIPLSRRVLVVSTQLSVFRATISGILGLWGASICVTILVTADWPMRFWLIVIGPPLMWIGFSRCFIYGARASWNLYRLITHAPALVITRQGITNNMILYGVFYSWDTLTSLDWQDPHNIIYVNGIVTYHSLITKLVAAFSKLPVSWAIMALYRANPLFLRRNPESHFTYADSLIELFDIPSYSADVWKSIITFAQEQRPDITTSFVGSPLPEWMSG